MAVQTILFFVAISAVAVYSQVPLASCPSPRPAGVKFYTTAEQRCTANLLVIEPEDCYENVTGCGTWLNQWYPARFPTLQDGLNAAQVVADYVYCRLVWEHCFNPLTGNAYSTQCGFCNSLNKDNCNRWPEFQGQKKRSNEEDDANRPLGPSVDGVAPIDPSLGDGVTEDGLIINPRKNNKDGMNINYMPAAVKKAAQQRKPSDVHRVARSSGMSSSTKTTPPPPSPTTTAPPPPPSTTLCSNPYLYKDCAYGGVCAPGYGPCPEYSPFMESQWSAYAHAGTYTFRYGVEGDLGRHLAAYGKVGSLNYSVETAIIKCVIRTFGRDTICPREGNNCNTGACNIADC